MSFVNVIAVIGIIAAFGAFMATLALVERTSSSTWPEFK